MTQLIMTKTPQEAVKERRFKAIRFSLQSFIEMFSAGKAITFKTDKPLPADSAVLSAMYDSKTDNFLLKILSEEFEPVAEGQEVPRLDVLARITPCKCNQK